MDFELILVQKLSVFVYKLEFDMRFSGPKPN